MGSAHSMLSETTAVTLLVAGAAAVAYRYTHHQPEPSGSAAVTAPAPKSGKKKKKQVASPTPSSSLTQVDSGTTTPSPNVVALPPVIPGGFDTAEPSSRDTTPPAKTGKAGKKKKGKKAGTLGPGTSRVVPVDENVSDSSATAPESHATTTVRPPASKVRKSSTTKVPTLDTDEQWTRIESRKLTTPHQLVDGTSDAGVTTTSITGTSSPAAERTDDEGHSTRPVENRRTLAERLLPKPRKTGVDDMLETPDYPSISRVMRIQPGPNDKPAVGFSWGDYEDVDDSRTADDADGEDDGGWGVVKSRSRKTQKNPPTTTPTIPETVTKKQRQNATKREAQKAAKADAEAERLARLAKHQRELERAKIAEQYGRPGKSTSGGMTAYVDENGKLVWK